MISKIHLWNLRPNLDTCKRRYRFQTIMFVSMNKNWGCKHIPKKKLPWNQSPTVFWQTTPSYRGMQNVREIMAAPGPGYPCYIAGGLGWDSHRDEENPLYTHWTRGVFLGISHRAIGVHWQGCIQLSPEPSTYGAIYTTRKVDGATVLVYHGPLLIHLFGVANYPSTFTTEWTTMHLAWLFMIQCTVYTYIPKT